MTWAGYVVVRGGSGLWGAGGAGVAILVLDHLVLKGGWFLVEHMRGARIEGYGEDSFLLAFLGVVGSFVMYAPAAGVIGLCGGIIGRRSLSYAA